MHRIDNASAATSQPTPKPQGPDGYFTAGNPTTGQQATIVEADFLNNVQEELINIVLKGGLTPDNIGVVTVTDAGDAAMEAAATTTDADAGTTQ